MRRACPAILLLHLTACIPEGGGPAYDPRPAPVPQASAPYEPQRVDDGVTALPAPAPAWESRRVTADARTVEAGSHIVRPGETLRSIAETTGAGSEAIARANALAPPFVIRPDQRLTIPGGRYHLVRAGETGIAIARAYGIDWSRVVTANLLAEPYILRVGQRVLIPGEGMPSAAERAAAFRLDIDDLVTGSEPALATNQRPARAVATVTRQLPATAAVAPPRGSPGQFLWPVRGSIARRFGPGGSGERNDGIKIAAPLNTPILAAADGTVAYVGSAIPALGGLVIVKHGGTLTTVYGHASQLLVQRGQAVKRGQTLALLGRSGFADRPELHFEVRQGRTPVDPMSKLPAR
jgi:murein DD-endopeptidase MepM/ murein hydrolase activator NlpD